MIFSENRRTLFRIMRERPLPLAALSDQHEQRLARGIAIARGPAVGDQP